MNDYPRVSIIVPVYNVEKFLPQCLESISNQKYPNIEVVLVDDGSPDRCGELCEIYARKHKNTIVVHQANSGLSVARNNGVKESTGEFITFVDSDDYISDDYVLYLVTLVTSNKADIAIGAHLFFYDGKELKEKRKEHCIAIMNSEEALERMCYSKGFSVNAWSKLYRRELVLRYPYPAGKLYEDIATTYKIFGDATKIVYGNKFIYFWRQRKGSISYKPISKDQLFGIEAAKNQLDYISEHFPNIKSSAEAKCAARIIDFVPRTIGKNKDLKNFRFLQKELEAYYVNVKKDKRAKLSLRIRCFALHSGYLMSCIVFKTHDFLKRISY